MRKSNIIACSILLLISAATALFMYTKIGSTWDTLTKTVTVPFSVVSVSTEQKYLGSANKNFTPNKLYNYATVNIGGEIVSALVPPDTEINKSGDITVTKTYIDGRAGPLMDLNSLYVVVFVLSAAIFASTIMAMAVESGKPFKIISALLVVVTILSIVLMSVVKTINSETPIGFGNRLTDTIVIEQMK